MEQEKTALVDCAPARAIASMLASNGVEARPYQVIFASRFDQALRKEIQNDEMRALPSRLPAVDQLTDLAGAIRSPILTGRMRQIYFARGQ